MLNAYEAIYLVDATLAEDQVNAIVEKYNGILTRNGGVIDDVDIWDPRRTAYEVKGRREARYVVVNFQSSPAAKDELNRIFGISDDVLRSMVVRSERGADRFPSRARAAERAADQERRDRDAAARAAAEAAAEAQAEPAPAPADEPEQAPAETVAEETSEA
ncbi:MAG: 30S ribosomal protein S6 [Armatimonadota bacterium]